MKELTRSECLQYEIHSHWLASWIASKKGQQLMGRYFAWKVRRKYNRYSASISMLERVKKYRELKTK